MMLMLLLTGCGSNSKTDSNANSGTSSSPGLTIEGAKINEDNYPNFSLKIKVEKEYDRSYQINLSDFVLHIDGCEVENMTYDPASLILNGNAGEEAILNISGLLDGDCYVKGYSLHGLQTTVKNGKTYENDIKYDYTYEEGDENGSLVRKMYITPDSFAINSPDEEQEITIVTVDARNNGLSTTVQLEQPHNGTDYGQFESNSVTTNESGYAVIKYKAPKDISGLVERNITVTETSRNIRRVLNIQFNTITHVSQYEIEAITPDAFPVDKRDYLTIKIVNISNGQVINDKDVKDVILKSKMSNMLLFENGQDQISYKELGENNAIVVQSQTLSGVAIIEVTATVFDGVKDIQFSTSIPVTIISGPVTALSIPYVSSGGCSSDPTGMLSANKHLVHAVDKYSNPAKVRITPTLINGTKLVVPNPNYGAGTGQMSSVSTFSDNSASFGTLSTEDRLIITPNPGHTDYSYLGNWTIEEVLNEHKLKLSERYEEGTHGGLSYVIGNEERLLGRDTVIAHVVDPSGKYETDENGMLLLEVCFDPKLAGHTFTLGAYAQGEVRTGIATIAAFRWDQYVSEEAEVDNDSLIHTVYLGLGIGGKSNEHLMDVDINPLSILVEKEPHCTIDYGQSNFHTDAGGNVRIVLNTDGNTSETGGVDKCKLKWDAKPGSILYEY
jgi:hypothetical protein